jgi:hypothetical protein
MGESPTEQEIEDMYFDYIRNWVIDRINNRLDFFLDPNQLETEIHNSVYEMKQREIDRHPTKWKGRPEDYSIVEYSNKWFFDHSINDVKKHIEDNYSGSEKETKLKQLEDTINTIENRRFKAKLKEAYKTK